MKLSRERTQKWIFLLKKTSNNQMTKQHTQCTKVCWFSNNVIWKKINSKENDFEMQGDLDILERAWIEKMCREKMAMRRLCTCQFWRDHGRMEMLLQTLSLIYVFPFSSDSVFLVAYCQTVACFLDGPKNELEKNIEKPFKLF